MTFEEVLKVLEAKYPKEYKALRYEKVIDSDGSTKTRVSIYVASHGWTNDHSTYETAIAEMSDLRQSPPPSEDC